MVTAPEWIRGRSCKFWNAMKNIILFLSIFLASFLPLFSQTAHPEVTDRDIEKLDWMLGTWKGQLGTKTYIERWYAEPDGTIRGIGHYVANHDSTLAEVLIIQRVGDRLVYIAYPLAQSPTMFVFTEATHDHFLVENPEHDFPQQIGYKVMNEDEVVATVGGGGKEFKVKFTKVKD
jgi:Domain of unknown function (DUF6265)